MRRAARRTPTSGAWSPRSSSAGTASRTWTCAASSTRSEAAAGIKSAHLASYRSLERSGNVLEWVAAAALGMTSAGTAYWTRRAMPHRQGLQPPLGAYSAGALIQRVYTMLALLRGVICKSYDSMPEGLCNSADSLLRTGLVGKRM